MGHARLDKGRLTRGGRWYGPFATLSQKLPLGSMGYILLGVWFAIIDPRACKTAPQLSFCCPGADGRSPLPQSRPELADTVPDPRPPFVLTASGALVPTSRCRWPLRALIATLVAWNIWSTISVRPNYLSYGNELVGGHKAPRGCSWEATSTWDRIYSGSRSGPEGTGKHPPRGDLLWRSHGGSCGTKEQRSPSVVPLGEFRVWYRTLSDGGNFYWAISSNILNGLTTAPLSIDGRSVIAAIESPLLKPENATTCVGDTIFIFRISTSGYPPGGSALQVRDLRAASAKHAPEDAQHP